MDTSGPAGSSDPITGEMITLTHWSTRIMSSSHQPVQSSANAISTAGGSEDAAHMTSLCGSHSGGR